MPWGEPELARIPGGDAGHYYGWLDDKVTPLASLAQLHHELGFGDSADSQALEPGGQGPALAQAAAEADGTRRA